MISKMKVKRICKQRGLQLWETKENPYFVVEVMSPDGFKFRLREYSLFKSYAYDRIYNSLTEKEPESKRII